MPAGYAEPRTVEDLSDCYFYHTMDVPGAGRINGSWNLLNNLDAYLGGVEFAGKRVLDVGCATGLLSFHMERRGAEREVVSFDLDARGDWDLVPFAKYDQLEQISRVRRDLIGKLNNAYLFAHRRFQSRAKVVYGQVYDIPSSIGIVDAAVYGCILLHLRDPFLALQKGMRLVNDTVVIAEPLWGSPESRPDASLPDASTSAPKDSWWDILPEWVVRAIGVLGFEDSTVTYHTQLYEGRESTVYTVVGRRTHGTARAD